MWPLPLIIVGRQTLARDESVRKFGLMITVGGLLAVAAILVSPQFFRVGLLEDPLIQGGIMMMGVLISDLLRSSSAWTEVHSPRLEDNVSEDENGLFAVGHGIYIPLKHDLRCSETWVILYRLTDSVAAALALMGVQLLVVGYCYVQYRKTLAANPALAS